MEVVKDLTCPICLEFYSHPVILPCSHIMCKQPCADQLFEGNFIRCPVCRDNCYVSGGLSSLPRVITIESIIEKVRAERKKRNANSNGQSSFDDVFSDVTSENRESEGTPVSSTSPSVPICNSPDFPEGRSSPVSFSPRARINSLGSTSNVLLRPIPPRYATSTSNAWTPSMSSQESTPRNRLEDSTIEDQSRSADTISLRNTRQSNEAVTSFSSFSDSTLTDANQYNFPTLSNYTNDNVPRHSSNNVSRFTTRRLSQNPSLSQVTETYSVNRRGRENRGRPISHLNSESIVPQMHQTGGSAGVTSLLSCPEVNLGGAQFVGAGSNTFTTDQVVQTSTPRSDLRNIRLCHEQSLANLKACSDSIRALQQSRPFFRGSHVDSSFNSYTTGHEIATNRNNQCSNEGDETSSFLGHITDILLDSSGSDETPRVENSDNTLVSSLANGIHPYTSPPYNNASVNPIMQTSPNFETCQLVCESENISATGNDVPENGLVCEERHQNEAIATMEEEDSGEVSSVKLGIQNHLQKLCDIQNQLLFHMNSFTEKAQIGEDQYDKGRSDINKECDSLVAEIENKRYHFLLHMDDERKKRRTETSYTTVAMQNLLASSQELSLFVEEILESRPQTILSTASSLLDSLSSAVAECQACLQTSTDNDDTESDNNFKHHLIDTRLQRRLVQGLDYLSLPERPVFYVERCTRNTSSVALVLQPPPFGNAIDHYEITYCSEDQKTLGIEERYYAAMPDDPDLYGGINPEVFPAIIIENLCQSTHYFFCACAVNRKGKSLNSDYVQCKTLAHRDCVVPVPSVIENRCEVGATSVTLTCPSLATVTSHQRVHHSLLQKTHNGAFVWKGAELTCKKEEFLVKNLRPETHYNFGVIAYNGRGECQVSNIVGLQTHPLESNILDTV